MKPKVKDERGSGAQTPATKHPPYEMHEGEVTDASEPAGSARRRLRNERRRRASSERTPKTAKVRNFPSHK